MVPLSALPVVLRIAHLHYVSSRFLLPHVFGKSTTRNVLDLLICCEICHAPGKNCDCQDQVKTAVWNSGLTTYDNVCLTLYGFDGDFELQGRRPRQEKVAIESLGADTKHARTHGHYLTWLVGYFVARQLRRSHTGPLQSLGLRQLRFILLTMQIVLLKSQVTTIPQAWPHPDLFLRTLLTISSVLVDELLASDANHESHTDLFDSNFYDDVCPCNYGMLAICDRPCTYSALSGPELLVKITTHFLHGMHQKSADVLHSNAKALHTMHDSLPATYFSLGKQYLAYSAILEQAGSYHVDRRLEKFANASCSWRIHIRKTAGLSNKPLVGCRRPGQWRLKKCGER